MSDSDALAWLYGVQKFGVKLGLDNTRRLLDALEIDTGGVKIFHVAGTNGKGSTCAFLESICRAAGQRTGLFTSPHLVSFNERVRLNFQPVGHDLIDTQIERIRALTANWDPHPTFFEIATALAMRVFLDAGVETIVLETGLGGRLDATNAIESDVAVITQIALDHQKHLGNTIEEIAAEKAGIIKPGKIVITGNQPIEAERVISARAAEVGGEIRLVEEPWAGELGMAGPHQRWNAALAAAAVDFAPEIVAAGLKSANWPGRFHVIEHEGATVVIDGAHNPAAARVLAQTWRERFGDQKAAIVFGAVEDKDPEGVLKELLTITGALFPTSIPTQRGLSADEIVERVNPAAARVAPSVEGAIHMAESTNLPVLITGSLFLVGKALEVLGWSERAFEASEQ